MVTLDWELTDEELAAVVEQVTWGSPEPTIDDAFVDCGPEYDRAVAHAAARKMAWYCVNWMYPGHKGIAEQDEFLMVSDQLGSWLIIQGLAPWPDAPR